MEIIKHDYKVNNKLSTRKKTTKVILHCSATPEGKDFTVETIDKWHKERKFSCIGYQYVIYRDGTIHQGRPEETVGAHCTDYNSISVGVCYIGGTDKNGKAKDTRTKEQKETLYELVEYLLKKYNLRITDVYGHRDFANKACPSFSTQQFRDEFIKWKDKKYEQKLKEQNSKVGVCSVKDWF